MGPEDTSDTSQQGAPSITIPSFRPAALPTQATVFLSQLSASLVRFADARHGRHGWVGDFGGGGGERGARV